MCAQSVNNSPCAPPPQIPTHPFHNHVSTKSLSLLVLNPLYYSSAPVDRHHLTGTPYGGSHCDTLFPPSPPSIPSLPPLCIDVADVYR